MSQLLLQEPERSADEPNHAVQVCWGGRPLMAITTSKLTRCAKNSCNRTATTYQKIRLFYRLPNVILITSVSYFITMFFKQYLPSIPCYLSRLSPSLISVPSVAALPEHRLRGRRICCGFGGRGGPPRFEGSEELLQAEDLLMSILTQEQTLGGKRLEMVRDGQGMSGWRKKVLKFQEYLRLQSRCLRCATILFRAAGLNALQTQMPPHMTRILGRCGDM